MNAPVFCNVSFFLPFFCSISLSSINVLQYLDLYVSGCLSILDSLILYISFNFRLIDTLYLVTKPSNFFLISFYICVLSDCFCFIFLKLSYVLSSFTPSFPFLLFLAFPNSTSTSIYRFLGLKASGKYKADTTLWSWTENHNSCTYKYYW